MAGEIAKQTANIEEQKRLLFELQEEHNEILDASGVLAKARVNLARVLFDVSDPDKYYVGLEPEEIAWRIRSSFNYDVVVEGSGLNPNSHIRMRMGVEYFDCDHHVKTWVGESQDHFSGIRIMPNEDEGYTWADARVIYECAVKLITLRQNGTLPDLAFDLTYILHPDDA